MSMRTLLGLVFIVASHSILRIEAAPPTDAGQAACSSLVSSLGSELVQSQSGSDFQDSVNTPLNLINTALVPACVVYPTNTSHVSTAMAAIYKAKSRYAVLAGGHSAMKGWNNVAGGVLIDFKDMKQATYDAQRDTITLQPGIRWGEVVAALAPQGVAPVGGRAAHVGSGFLLGGGISFLSPSRGWGADNFRELDVVLVNGTVVTANANNQYKDLFKALKGGGNRFGIVTRYEVDAYHTGTPDDKRWVVGVIQYPESSVEAVVKATARYTKDVKDPNATIFSTLVENVSDSGEITTIMPLYVFYQGKELPKSIFGEFLSIPSTNSSISPMSYADIAANIFPREDGRGSTFIFGSSALSGKDEKAFLDVYRTNLKFTKENRKQLSMTAITYTPIPDSQIEYGRKHGGNAIDAPLTGGYAVIQMMQTLRPGEVEVPKSILDAKKKLLDQNKRTPGLPLFLNECDANQNILASYGQYDFLKKTYKKYDPQGFNTRFTDGPMGL
ncbi:fad binding domain-containing protein [Moniliophthora roreri]|uniref:FAD-binding PCMH-type domain-containing protein n=1 Tax=Moniliophthora roreri TaxID=221103 RepID=A0A0W0G9A3_MONRR|nr:fad binding domain-containing protein [Moniliophthora roreri]